MTIDAVVEKGLLRPLVPVALKEGTRVRITFEHANAEIDPLADILAHKSMEAHKPSGKPIPDLQTVREWMSQAGPSLTEIAIAERRERFE